MVIRGRREYRYDLENILEGIQSGGEQYDQFGGEVVKMFCVRGSSVIRFSVFWSETLNSRDNPALLIVIYVCSL